MKPVKVLAARLAEAEAILTRLVNGEDGTDDVYQVAVLARRYPEREGLYGGGPLSF